MTAHVLQLEQARLGAKFALVSGFLYLAAIPLHLVALKEFIEGTLGDIIRWETLLETLDAAGYRWLTLASLMGPFVLSIGCFVGMYSLRLGRLNAAFLIIILGVVGVLLSVAYIGWTFGILGIAAGLLSVLGGAVAIRRPRLGRPVKSARARQS